MLHLIRIKNYAIIDEIEVELGPGFSVMTGETGAGKSILVDALGLALGDRADASTVRPSAEKAEISVLFECPANHPALDWLEEHGLEDDHDCSLRRVISAEGRSRAFINNHPVTLQDLKALGELLIDIHGQHAHQSLLHTPEQRRLLDSTGRLGELATEVAEKFGLWKQLARELDQRVSSNADRQAQIEALRFQLKDLDELALQAGELLELQSEHGRLANIDAIAQGVQTALGRLYEDEDGSAYSMIAHAARELEALGEHDPKLAEAAEQLGAVEIEARDIATSLLRYREQLEPDPPRLEYIETRLARIRSLSRRHGVAEESLHELQTELAGKLADVEGGELSIAALEAKVAEAETAYMGAAVALSRARSKHAAALGKTVSAKLKELGLPDGEFRAHIERRAPERYDSTGIDRIAFEVRLNPGHPFGAIERVASGGELSRISLALSVVDTGESAIPTFVFDEVDAGIGGGVAEIVGNRLREIAERHQVLCVTHLPQVASQGHQHYRISKLSDGKTSRTLVRRLNDAERIEELSRMLGGVEITEQARAHAAEMIARGAK